MSGSFSGFAPSATNTATCTVELVCQVRLRNTNNAFKDAPCHLNGAGEVTDDDIQDIADLHSGISYPAAKNSRTVSITKDIHPWTGWVFTHAPVIGAPSDATSPFTITPTVNGDVVSFETDGGTAASGAELGENTMTIDLSFLTRALSAIF